MKKAFRFLFTSALFMAMGVTSCGGTIPARTNTSEGDIVESVKFQGIEQTKMNLEMGESIELIPVITYKEGKSGPVTPIWRNTNSKVVTLLENSATAIGYGQTTVSVIAGYAMCTLTIKVNKPEEPVSHTFELSDSLKSFNIGDTYTLFAFYDNVSVDPEWFSSEESVASVTSEGLVTALSAGSTVISASYQDMNASCNVTVREEGHEFVLEVSPKQVSLQVGGTQQLSVTTSEPALIGYSSSNETVATVSETGLITALKDGSATITVSANGVSEYVYVDVSSGEGRKDATVYFFLDYNNYDLEDDSVYLACFKWYRNRPLATSGDIPANPTKAPDPAFPIFLGWSSKAIIDSTDDLWDMENDTIGTDYILFLFGIWVAE